MSGIDLYVVLLIRYLIGAAHGAVPESGERAMRSTLSA